MAEPLAKRSALAHLGGPRIGDAGRDARIVVRLLTGRAYVLLRLRIDDEPAAAIQAVLGGDLPPVPNSVKTLPAATAYCLGPDEWLAEIPDADTAPLLQTLEQRASGHFAAITDVTDAKASFAITGGAAIDVLRKGCPIDLHPDVFGSRSCAQTSLARASVLVVCVAAGAQYTVIADRSDADYLWRWLEDAAVEFTKAGIPAPTIEEQTQ